MKINTTPIQGLLVIEGDVFSDDRGYFLESFQREKLIALGFPESFIPVQINFVFNNKAGVLRGIHAEPWAKYVSLTKGEALGVFVDLREGDNFGKTHTVKLKSGVAVYVPLGVGNSYQTLEDGTYYVYAVSGHWQPDQNYVGVNPFDPKLNIAWPVPKANAIISEKDKDLPNLEEIKPF